MVKQDDLILVAKLISPHGINGAVTADCLSDNPQRFAAGEILLTDDNKQYTIESASMHKGRLLLYLEGIENRDQAEMLRGLPLYAYKSSSAPLPEGEYYYYQIEGLEVREGTKRLGIVKEILNYSANDIYVVSLDEGGEILLPALKSVVKLIDIEEGFMEVEIPYGLDKV